MRVGKGYSGYGGRGVKMRGWAPVDSVSMETGREPREEGGEAEGR